MDKTLVKLEICIKYEGDEKMYKNTFTEFKSFEELKDISIKHFNIKKEEIEIMKFAFLEDLKNKSIKVNNDNDLISCMKEIDEYHYSIKLELSLDKTIEERKQKIKKLLLNKLNKDISSFLILLKKCFCLKEELNEEIKNYITNDQNQKSLNELLNEFPNNIHLSKKEENGIVNKINDNLFYSKLVREVSENFNKKMEDIKIKQDNLKKQIQHNFDDIFELIKKNTTNIIKGKNKDINEIKIDNVEGRNNENNKKNEIKNEAETKKPMYGKNIDANIINNKK